MKSSKLFIAVFFISAIACEGILQAQETGHSPEYDKLQSGIARLYALNDSLFDRQDNLINGRLFSPVGDFINHPYFIANEWNSGKIWYSGRICETERLKFDIVSDNLINVFTVDGNTFPVTLNREITREFSIAGHHFLFFGPGQVDGQLRTGYYEVLYEGVTCFYVRHEKSKNLNKFTLETEYALSNTGYLKRAGKFIQVKNQHDFIRSLGDHGNEVRAFMKKNNIRFNSGNYEPIIEVLEYYDKLNLI